MSTPWMFATPWSKPSNIARFLASWALSQQVCAGPNRSRRTPHLRDSLLLLDGPIHGPGDAKRILQLGVSIAPEHVCGRHGACAASLSRTCIPGIDVLNHERQGVSGRLPERM